MREEEGRRDGKEVEDLVGGRKRDREKSGKGGGGRRFSSQMRHWTDVGTSSVSSC